jgi:hypothetical protein
MLKQLIAIMKEDVGKKNINEKKSDFGSKLEQLALAIMKEEWMSVKKKIITIIFGIKLDQLIMILIMKEDVGKRRPISV